MFEVDMRERGDGSVNLDNQSPDAVSSFLDFAYSGEMLITDSNVDMLFQIASFLQVPVCPSLIIWQYLTLSFSDFTHWSLPALQFANPQVSVLSKACGDFLIGIMDLSNCLSLFSIAEAYGSAALLRSAEGFMIENFHDLSKTQDFLEMQVTPAPAVKHISSSRKSTDISHLSDHR